MSWRSKKFLENCKKNYNETHAINSLLTLFCLWSTDVSACTRTKKPSHTEQDLSDTSSDPRETRTETHDEASTTHRGEAYDVES